MGVGLNPTPIYVGLNPTVFCTVLGVGLNPTFCGTVLGVGWTEPSVFINLIHIMVACICEVFALD